MNQAIEKTEQASSQKAELRRQRMIDAALEVFTAQGYVGTSTDQLAAAAAVSKQTIYKAFGDKKGVFTALIHAACDGIDDPFAPMLAHMRAADSADKAVTLLAGQFVHSIMKPEVQQLRRLVIAEASRFPELGTLFWEQGFLRVSESVGRCLQILHERELLNFPDMDMAVQHFAGMLLWIPSNQVMFTGSYDSITKAELERISSAGAATFVRAYQPRLP